MSRAQVWMGARVVDWARLESVCTARYRGFESLPIRHAIQNQKPERCRSIAGKLLYLGREKRNMLPMMRWQRCSWFLALLAAGAALFLASCADQEGVAPAEGELKDRPQEQQ